MVHLRWRCERAVAWQHWRRRTLRWWYDDGCCQYYYYQQHNATMNRRSNYSKPNLHVVDHQQHLLGSEVVYGGSFVFYLLFRALILLGQLLRFVDIVVVFFFVRAFAPPGADGKTNLENK